MTSENVKSEKGGGIDSPTTLTRNHLIAAFAVALLALCGFSASALAQSEGPTATPSPMILPAIPRIQLLPVPGYGPAPLTVGFLLSSQDPETVLQTFTWNFGDGHVSMLPPTIYLNFTDVHIQDEFERKW